MTETTKRSAGYIRVSSKEQVDGESLSTQRKSIRDFSKQQGWKLTEIYADEGISGGSVKKRHALLQCLHDAKDGQFDVLVIHRLSRFGRNARELLNNHDELEKVGIQLRSISEGIDFGNKYGKAMLGMFAIMAELEKDIIKEQMLENRIARAKKGIPTAGRLPIGRTFDKQTGKWALDEKIANHLRWAAKKYLEGESLVDLSRTLKERHGMPCAYTNLIKTLSKCCGDTWTVNFEGAEPITYEIPRILDDETIKRVKERLEHNRINCRKDIRKYALSGFIRCEACGKTLTGQTQLGPFDKETSYYRHPGKRYSDCKSFTSIRKEMIENAVFKTIFENTVDVPAFERAIADSLPDENLINSLRQKIKSGESELRRIEEDLDRLIDAVINGTLEKATIKHRETSLLNAKSQVTEELQENQERLNSLPDLELVKIEAEFVRRQLMMHFSSHERLKEMTYEDKKSSSIGFLMEKTNMGHLTGFTCQKTAKRNGITSCMGELQV